MQGLWEALSCKGRMTAGKCRETSRHIAVANAHATSDVAAPILQLREQFETVKANDAFLRLKESEYRPDDEISLFGLMNAREQLNIERSLLGGHALMIMEMADKKEVSLNRESQLLLREIQEYTTREFMRGA